MRFDVITLFPDIFRGFLAESILSKAIERQLVEVHLWNLRDWSGDPHRRVDDRPFGGGPGMVIRVEPVVTCVESIRQHAQDSGRCILLTPQGQRLCQPLVETLATEDRLILLCGRYEGFDHRVVEILQPEEVSLGDFVLNGGEVAAMALIEATTRLLPDVLGDPRSSQDDTFSMTGRQLKYEQYTRPRDFRGHVVPDVLISGNHQEIEQWRQRQSQLRSEQRIPEHRFPNQKTNP